jgi:hypothetical protein
MVPDPTGPADPATADIGAVGGADETVSDPTGAPSGFSRAADGSGELVSLFSLVT